MTDGEAGEIRRSQTED